jgi:hypothetical protein
MTEHDPDGKALSALRHSIRATLREASPSYDALHRTLRTLAEGVREEAARALQPALNERVARIPHATYEEKKSLAKWVNTELRQLHLAIRCPKTGRPSLLQANPGSDPMIGRFRLDYMDDQGRRRTPISSIALPQLELIPDSLDTTPHRTRGQRSR